MSILITGGAGYIGSHTALALIDAGRAVVVLDDLSTGCRDLVPAGAVFVQGDAGDVDLVARLVAEHGIESVIHFAGSTIVPESIDDPLKYYRNNTCVGRRLVQACAQLAVPHFIFSSTAAVYGNPERLPVAETAATVPLNPYGSSKLATEWIIRDTARATGLKHVTLRYFNVAGADPSGRSGQATPGATQLIKVASETALGRRPLLEVFGTDYDTPDGTCIRDFIHVTDLADAHVRALDHLEAGGASEVLNCGYGRGYSVRDVIDAIERETGRQLNKRFVNRRAGDPAAVVAEASRIRSVLQWQPRYAELELIVRSSLEWESLLADRAAR